jgi:hypothetical protein
MSWALLALALLGVAAWFRLLGRGETPSSLFRLLVEAAAIHTVAVTLVAVALVSFGAFRPAVALALGAALPLAALPRRDRSREPSSSGAPLLSPRDRLVLLVLALALPVALPRMEQLRMDSDAGVYANRAIHHLRTGGLRGSIPVRARLEGELLEIFDRDNMQGPRHYLPGTYVRASEPGRFHFQFYPGWPLVMALWASVFGVGQASFALVFLYALGVLLFGLLLERLVEGTAARATALAIFASSPLLLYFSKYTTSEVLLLFLFLFVLHFLGGGSRGRAVLAALGVLLFTVSHTSTFLYAPLLLLPLLEAGRSADRRMALFSLLSFGALLLGLPLGHFFSPIYLRDIYAASFGFLPVSDPAPAGLGLVAAFYAAGLAASLFLLARPAGPASRLGAWTAHAGRLLPRVVPPALALVAAWTAWRGYQLGWTDRFTPPLVGAWSARAHYAGQGWPSVAHLDLVSMVLATSLVGLPVVLALAAWRGREVCASPARALLLCTVLWTLAVYTFFRVDTPVNYYASRYFLPVLVPATLLLLGSLLGHFRPPRGGLALLALVALAFNLTFDRGLLLYPSETEKMAFVEEVARRAEGKRVLFVRAGEPIHRLLAVLLPSLSGIEVVRVAHLRGRPETAVIERYAAALGLAAAAVLTTVAPPAGRAYAELSLVDRRFVRQGIVYPTDHFEGRRTCYLYELVFARDDEGGPAVPPP